jgi:bifunctional non-homologous end joining protein LigD
MEPVPAERIMDVDGRAIWLTHPDRKLFDSGYTKAEVVDYYMGVAGVLLPHLAGRPLTMIRFPDGVAAGGFFAKNAPAGTPGWVRRATLATSDGDVEQLVVESRAALAWLASMSAIELHIPLWTVQPGGGPAGSAGGEPFAGSAGGEPFAGSAGHDRLMIDLDPGSGAGIPECAMVALALREALAAVGLDAVAKTSGAAGMHLLVPVAPTPAQEAVGFVRGLAEALAATAPDLATTRIGERERSGRVLLDWRQNVFLATAVAPYSLRAGHSPGVSTPITWDEVAAAAAGMELAFDPNTVRERILAHGDLASALLVDERPPLPSTAE